MSRGDRVWFFICELLETSSSFLPSRHCIKNFVQELPVPRQRFTPELKSQIYLHSSGHVHSVKNAAKKKYTYIHPGGNPVLCCHSRYDKARLPCNENQSQNICSIFQVVKKNKERVRIYTSGALVAMQSINKTSNDCFPPMQGPLTRGNLLLHSCSKPHNLTRRVLFYLLHWGNKKNDHPARFLNILPPLALPYILYQSQSSSIAFYVPFKNCRLHMPWCVFEDEREK